MRNTLYQYNAKTCQYERVRVKTPDVLFYMSGIVVVALLMLAGMLTIHDYIFDSAREIALRQENAALSKNQVILASQLNTIEATLSELGLKDEKLHQKFFGSPMEKPPEAAGIRSANKHLLLADPSTFIRVVEMMRTRSSELLMQSAITSSFYGNQLTLSEKQLRAIGSMPLLQPIQPWNSDNVISGFGMRVNPFHKGLYEHPGVDIAMPRGSEVIATASGTVIEINKSIVQAGYGNYIEIDHGNGFITRYAHLEDIHVKYRQKITRGSIIATVGNSGGSIAPHLHYEIIRNGITVDPVHYMIDGLSSNEHHQLKLISQKQNQSLD
jgi:murein DD-endopeptidase MepM/ murein hydrolase activator NlpD